MTLAAYLAPQSEHRHQREQKFADVEDAQKLGIHVNLTIIDQTMQHIELTQTDGLLTIRMARAKANALNSELVADLREAIGTAAADSKVRGAVLASAMPGIFSAGFDAREI